MKRIIYSIMAAGMLTLVSGCSDDFLDKSPSNAITTDEAITTLQDLSLIHI